MEEHTARKKNKTGTIIIQPTKNCHVDLSALNECSYNLADAYWQERLQKKNNYGYRYYYMVRFVFARNEERGIEDVYCRYALCALEQMCRTAHWRVRSYYNPVFQNGKIVEHSCSINLEVRCPVEGTDGRKITRWMKDEKGEKIGEAPLPIRASARLVVEEGVLKLLNL